MQRLSTGRRIAGVALLVWPWLAPLAQPAPPGVQVAFPRDPIFDRALADLRNRLDGAAAVERVGPATAIATLDALRRGDKTIAILPLSAVGERFPRFRVYDLPFTFSDPRSMMIFSDGPGRKALAHDLGLQGLGALGIWYGGAVVIASTQPMRSPHDFRGSKLVARSPRVAGQFASIGAVPARLPAGELYAALERGLVDAVEARWQEVPSLAPALTSVTSSNHRYAGYAVVFNRARFAALPTGVQQRITEALGAVGRRVSDAVLEREEQAKRQSLRSGKVTELAVNERVRTEWRASLAPSQAGEIERIGIEYVELARTPFSTRATAGSDGGRSALRWNAWFQGAPTEVSDVLVARNSYRFVLDLGRAEYPGALTGRISRLVGSEIDRHPDRAEIALLIRPVLIGAVLAPAADASLGSRMLRVQRTRLAPEPREPDLRAQLADKRITLQQFAREMSVAEPLYWDVVARDGGCARVALSIWDASGLRPLDYIVVTVPVRRENEEAPQCARGLAGGELAAGLQGLLAIDVDAPPGSRDADAALHLFDSDPGGDANATTVAVFVERSDFRAAEAAGAVPTLRAWELDGDFSKFLGVPARLPRSIASARAAFGSDSAPYRDVVRQMNAALFGGRTDEDRRVASETRAAMQRLAERDPPPILLTRYLGAGGQLRYVPLAMLAAQGPERVLARRVTIVQPLPSAPTTAREACFGQWDLAIPRLLDGVRADDAELLKQSDWRMSGERIAWYEDNPTLLQFLSGSETRRVGSALILLAHHGDGTITFSSSARPDRILTEEVRRNFPAGSVAVLAACSTTGASIDSRAFVNHLTRHGMSAFVVSPFQVDATFGTRLAVSFVESANEARSKGERPRLVDLFDRAVGRTIAAFGDHAGYRDMALEFQIVGDHELRLCAPSQPPT